MFATPMTGHLPARPIERAQKVLLGRRRRLRRTLQQDEFAFDAQQLGDAPALLVAFGPCECLVDNREPFGSFTVTTEGVRNLGEKWGVKGEKHVSGPARERAAQ